ncbi:hypothetical protein [Oscillatoria sp. FACHB-1407]|uniref:hypothetical protein n=1 Tax=Oscillatoria sp. FACHB-1407 TaxID=2692847 RepID=UPI0028160DFF|nr:hypothetical protein [Oscillatoria sp. FACHB-1407]
MEDDTTEWLRFYDAKGDLVFLPEEALQQQLEQERQSQNQLMEKLRQRGIDPNQL